MLFPADSANGLIDGFRPIADIASICHRVTMEHDDVQDQTSFAKYVATLRAQLDDPERRDEWENIDLASFLAAIAAWANDWKEPANTNPWRHAADILTAATIYE
jgi:hypothetical protein